MDNQEAVTEKMETVKDVYNEAHTKKNLNELIAKYKDGSATQEEVNYVEERVRKAREVAKVRLKDDKHIPFFTRVKRFFTVILVVVVLLVGLAGFGIYKVHTVARDNMVVTKTKGKDMLYEFVDQNFGAGTDVQIVSEKRKLVMTIPMERSYYLYEYKINVAGKGSFKVTVDSYSELMEYSAY